MWRANLLLKLFIRAFAYSAQLAAGKYMRDLAARHPAKQH